MKTLGLSLSLVLAPLTLCATNVFADTLSIVSGNNQSVRRGGNEVPGGTANFGPLSVVIKDAAGKPVAGKRVNFMCQTPTPAMACQMNPGGGGGVPATTDANGVATLNQMGGNSITIYYASGKFTVEAAADGVPAATFALEALDAPAPPAPVAGAVMTSVSGDAQTAARLPTASAIDTAEFAPLTVKVTAGGKPVSGVQITWTCSHPGAMACQSEPSGASPIVTTTDGNGVSVLNKMGGKSVSAYYADGAITMTASYGNANAAFHLTVAPAPASAVLNTLTVGAGNNQVVKRGGNTVPGGTANFGPLSVVFKDKAGKPISGARVNFMCQTPTPAMACQMNPGGGGGVPATTDANGVATLNQMGGNSITIYYASGKFTVQAAADGAKPVSFSLEAQDAPAAPAPIATAAMTALSGGGQKAARLHTASGIDTAEFGPLSVKVTNNGQPLSGVQVTWTCAHPAAMACQSEPSGASPIVTTTDGSGVAVLNKMGGNSVSAYYGDGAITMTATYGKASASFALTVAPAAAAPVVVKPAPVAPAPVAVKPAPATPGTAEVNKNLAAAYQSKLQKLAQLLEGSKLEAKEKSALIADIKGFADSLKSAPSSEAAEAKFQKLSEAVVAAVEGDKAQQSLFGDLRKKHEGLRKKLDSDKLDAAAKKAFLAKLEAALQPASCRTVGETIACGKASSSVVEKAGEQLEKITEEIELAIKNAGSKSLFASYEAKLDKLSKKIEASKADAAAKQKLTVEMDKLVVKLKDSSAKMTADAAEDALSKLNDEFDAAVEASDKKKP